MVDGCSSLELKLDLELEEYGEGSTLELAFV
jgi:hypothetical protein